MWRLCDQANIHGIARSASTPVPESRVTGPRADLHALDHVDRRDRLEELDERGIVVHEGAVQRPARLGEQGHGLVPARIDASDAPSRGGGQWPPRSRDCSKLRNAMARSP